MSDRPPPETTTSICVDPASMAFSTSSLTTLAGRSITSPAAMRLTVSGDSCLIATLACPPFEKRLSAFREALSGQVFRKLYARLIERIDAEQTARENRFDHKVHQQ